MNKCTRCIRSSIRQFSSQSLIQPPTFLVQKHDEFLSLVGDHGDGKIECNKITDKLSEIVIRNHAKSNAISGSMMLDLGIIIDDLLIQSKVGNNSARPLAVIIRNEGSSVFCSGADLGLVKDIVNTSERGYLMSQYVTDALNRLRQSDIITLSAINGKAVGGGAELITASDFRIMTENPDNYVSFVHAKLGWGGTGRLMSIVGRKNSLKLLCSSTKADAATAMSMGLIDDTMPSGATDEMILAKSIDILLPYLEQEYTESVRVIKQTIANYDTITDSAISFEQNVFKSRWGNTDNKKALKR